MFPHSLARSSTAVVSLSFVCPTLSYWSNSAPEQVHNQISLFVWKSDNAANFNQTNAPQLVVFNIIPIGSQTPFRWLELLWGCGGRWSEEGRVLSLRTVLRGGEAAPTWATRHRQGREVGWISTGAQTGHVYATMEHHRDRKEVGPKGNDFFRIPEILLNQSAAPHVCGL